MAEGFIARVIKATESTESPEIYHYWSQLAAIAAVLRNRVWIDLQVYKLLPNIYVFILGKSGMRKGPAINLALALTSRVNNTKILYGSVTIEGVIKDLSTDYSLPDGGIIKDASALLIASELGNFLYDSPHALRALTDLYDGQYNEKWTKTLKAAKEPLKDVCLTFLAGSNEAHLIDTVTGANISGGFVARTMIVRAEQRRTINSLMFKNGAGLDKAALAEELRDISKMEGEFSLTPEVRKEYDSWYKSFTNAKYEDPTGTLERLGDHILKTSMLLSASEDRSMEVRLKHIQEAIEACQNCTLNIKQSAVAPGKAELAPQTAFFMQKLLHAKDNKINRRLFLLREWANVDAMTLDRIVDNLIQAGAIEHQKVGIEIYYQMNKKVRDSYYALKKEEDHG